MNYYPTNKNEFKQYVKDAVLGGYFYKPEASLSAEKHNCYSYDGSTSAMDDFTVFTEDLSDSSKLIAFIDSGNYSVSAFSATNGKMEYLVHKSGCSLPQDYYTGSAYRPGDYYPSTPTNYFDVVSGFRANVHGFPCDAAYVLSRVGSSLYFVGELR